MTKPLILLFGSSGQVAQEIRQRAADRGVAVRALSRTDADLTDAEALTQAFVSASDDVVAVVNAAAYTAVDAAEDDPDTAHSVNALAPGIMARCCAERGLPFIHLSTDYVFDGSASGAYRETDPVAPLGVYGVTKQAGEQAVLDALPSAIILRTAWVFSAHGKNFVRTMLRLAAERDSLGVVDDQRGCPTPASSIAEAVLTIIGRWYSGQGAAGGIFHFCGSTPVSWKEFADAIFSISAEYGCAVPKVAPLATAQFPTRARRPANSVLDCGKILREWGIAPADWQASLKRDIEVILKSEPLGG